MPVHDADAAVHRLYEGEAVAADRGGVSRHDRGRQGRSREARRARGRRPPALQRLEEIVHPLVREAETAFPGRGGGARRTVVVLDIPLLFETGGEQRVDAVGGGVGAGRDAARAGAGAARHEPEKLEALLARQMPDAEKRAAGRFRRGYRAVESSTPARRCGRSCARLLECRDGEADSLEPEREQACARSCSTPKPPASIPSGRTGWSRSAASSSINRFPSGQTFHRYFNPERDMPEEAFKVHGLSVEFLKDKPLFCRGCEELIEFLGDAPLVAHNAIVRSRLPQCRARARQKALLARERLVDTLMLARRKHPGGSNRLDDLCARYRIDNSRRIKHGALLDAELLAEVYVELIGAPAGQPRPGRSDAAATAHAAGRCVAAAMPRPSRWRRGCRPRPNAPRMRHFIATLGEDAIWRDYLSATARCESLPSGVWRCGRCCICARAADRARRNRPDRAAAAGSRHCAPRSR